MRTEVYYKQKYRLEKRKNKYILNLCHYSRRLTEERLERIEKRIQENKIKNEEIEKRVEENEEKTIKLTKLVEMSEKKQLTRDEEESNSFLEFKERIEMRIREIRNEEKNYFLEQQEILKKEFQTQLDEKNAQIIALSQKQCQSQA